MLDIEYVTGMGGNVPTEFWGFNGTAATDGGANKENEPFLKWLMVVASTSDADVPQVCNNKMMNYASQMMNYASQMMKYASQMMNFLLKMMNFALKMMNFAALLDLLRRGRGQVKIMHSPLEMMHFLFEIMNFALELMNSA